MLVHQKSYMRCPSNQRINTTLSYVEINLEALHAVDAVFYSSATHS